jgi:hypothetical protein
MVKEFHTEMENEESRASYETWLNEACNVEPEQRTEALTNFDFKARQVADYKDSQNYIMTRNLRFKNVLADDEFVVAYSFFGTGRLHVETNKGYELVVDSNFEIIRVIPLVEK